MIALRQADTKSKGSEQRVVRRRHQVGVHPRAVMLSILASRISGRGSAWVVSGSVSKHILRASSGLTTENYVHGASVRLPVSGLGAGADMANGR
jgi:hypothetical protein